MFTRLFILLIWLDFPGNGLISNVARGSGLVGDAKAPPPPPPRADPESRVLWTFKSTESLNLLLPGEGQDTAIISNLFSENSEPREQTP